jgi:hypothetical protein
MDKKLIEKLILEQDLIVEEVIDVVIEINGIIGVGLISLGDALQEYVHNKINKRSSDG